MSDLIVAQDVLWSLFTQLPSFAAGAAELVNTVTDRWQRFRDQKRFDDLESRVNSLGDQLRNVMTESLIAALTDMKNENLSIERRLCPLKNIWEIQRQGYQPIFWEGVVPRDGAHWKKLKSAPETYGRLLHGDETLNYDTLKIVVQCPDKLRILKIEPVVLPRLLCEQAPAAEGIVVPTAMDVWSLTPTSRPVKAKAAPIMAHGNQVQAAAITKLGNRGFGFLATPQGESVFFHSDVVHDMEFDQLVVGQLMQYEAARNAKGLKATWVRPVA